MRKQILILLLFITTNPTIGQKIVLEMNEFEVMYRQDTFGRRHQYDLINTLHYDQNLNLEGWFTIHEAHHSKHPILKGKFNQNKLVDSLVGRDFYKGNLIFKGFFKEETKLTDTFNVNLDIGSFTFLGFPEGFFYEYDYEGKLYRTSDYKNGKKSYRKVYYQDNNITMIEDYLYSKLSTQVYYHNFGDSVVSADYCPKLKTGGTYAEYKQYGKIYSFKSYSQGDLSYESTFYSDGSSNEKSYSSIDGILSYFIEWYSNGQRKKYVSYDGDLKNGFFKEYYENGQTKKIGEYYCDSLEGKFIEYHENGKISEEGSFHRGWIEKGFRKYNEKGKYLGSYSDNANRRNSGPFVIYGSYIKEDIVEIPEIFHATRPNYKDTIPYSRKEKRLLQKYNEFKVNVEIFENRNEDFKEFGLIYIDNSELIIHKRDLAKLQLIINTHITFTSPFLVNNFPSKCSLAGILKFNVND